MERRTFFENVAKGVIASCYVLEGPEEYIKRSALETLRKRLLPEGLEDINETRLTDPDADTLIAASETLPFMSERGKYEIDPEKCISCGACEGVCPVGAPSEQA